MEEHKYDESISTSKYKPSFVKRPLTKSQKRPGREREQMIGYT